MKKLIILFILYFLISVCIEQNSNSVTIIDKTNIEIFDVVIIGGGISGLTAAFYLKDYNIKLLEKNNYCGGRTLSGKHNNLYYAKGTEYLGYPEKHLRKIINYLDLELIEIPSPMDAVYDKGKFYYGEDGIAAYYIQNSSLKELNRFIKTVSSLADKLEELDSDYIPKELEKYDKMSAANWIKEEGFSKVYYERLNVSARGLFGANLEEISALCLFPEIAYELEDAKPIDEDDVKYLNINPVTGEKTGAYTFKNGISEIPNALFQLLKEKIQLNSKVVNIQKTGTNYIITYNNNGSKKEILSKKIILAVPAPVVLKIARDIIKPTQLKDLKNVEYTTYITASLFSDKSIYNSAFDLTVPDGMFFSDLYDAFWGIRNTVKAEKNGGNILTEYIAPGSYKKEDLNNLTDKEIIDKTVTDLEKIFPNTKGMIKKYDIYKFKYAYPVMEPGSYQRILRLNKSNSGNVLLAGDYMLYPTFEAAVESGYEAAQIIIDND